MTPKYFDYLSEILGKLTSYKHELPSRYGGTCEDLQSLVLKFADNVPRAVVLSLLEFLQSADGVAWNGLGLFGSQPNGFLEGIVEGNSELQSDGLSGNFLVFGYDSLSLYLYNLGENQYQSMDRAGVTVYHRFHTFDELVRDALGRTLNLVDA